MYLGENIFENFYFLKIYSIAVKLFSPRREFFFLRFSFSLLHLANFQSLMKL